MDDGSNKKRQGKKLIHKRIGSRSVQKDSRSKITLVWISEAKKRVKCVNGSNGNGNTSK